MTNESETPRMLGNQEIRDLLLHHMEEDDPSRPKLLGPDWERAIETCVQVGIARGPIEHEAPFTEDEASNLVLWLLKPEDEASLPVGPHGPGCECDPVEAAAYDIFSGAMGMSPEAFAEWGGNTPAEKRTGVPDAEAAILGELKTLQALTQKYGEILAKATYEVGYAKGTRKSPDVILGLTAVTQGLVQSGRVIEAWLASAEHIRAWLPQVRGKHAVDHKGVPMYILTDMADRTVTASFAEPPGEGWKPLYIH